MDKDLLRLQTGDSTAEGLGLIPLLSTRLRAQGQGAERKKIKPKDQNSRPPSHFPALGSEWAHSSIAKNGSCILEWFHLISQILWISLAECPLGRTPHFLEVEAMRKQCVSTSLVPWSQQTFLPPWSHLQIQLLQKTAPLHWLHAELAPALFEVFNATFNTSLHPLPGPWCLHRAAAQGLGLKLALCIVQGKENPADSAESHGIGVSTACSQSRAPHQQTQGRAAGSWRVDAWQGLFSWHLGYGEGWRWLHGIWPKRWENHRVAPASDSALTVSAHRKAGAVTFLKFSFQPEVLGFDLRSTSLLSPCLGPTQLSSWLACSWSWFKCLSSSRYNNRNFDSLTKKSTQIPRYSKFPSEAPSRGWADMICLSPVPHGQARDHKSLSVSHMQTEMDCLTVLGPEGQD